MQNVSIAHTTGDVVTRVVEEECETHLVHGAWPTLQRHKDDQRSAETQWGDSFSSGKHACASQPYTDAVWQKRKKELICLRVRSRDSKHPYKDRLLCGFTAKSIYSFLQECTIFLFQPTSVRNLKLRNVWQKHPGNLLSVTSRSEFFTRSLLLEWAPPDQTVLLFVNINSVILFGLNLSVLCTLLDATTSLTPLHGAGSKIS